MKKYPYFTLQKVCFDGTPAPQPLSYAVQRPVRFEEVDPLNIVWHGRYPSYLEDARVAFGAYYGMGYEVFYRENTATPIKKMCIDYHEPLLFGKTYTVTATLHWTEAARINFSYTIQDADNRLMTTAYTVQLFLTPQNGLLMAQPDFYGAFCEKWKNFGAGSTW